MELYDAVVAAVLVIFSVGKEEKRNNRIEYEVNDPSNVKTPRARREKGNAKSILTRFEFVMTTEKKK